MRPFLLLVSCFALFALPLAVRAAEIPVIPFVQLLAPAIPGDPQQPDQLQLRMQEHAGKILREFDARHRYGFDRGIHAGFGANALRQAQRELDPHSFIAALSYTVTDPANAEVDIRLRMYDSQQYLKYEYNFYDVFHADNQSIPEITAQIANYAKDPKQFEALNEAGEETEALELDDYTALDLSEFSDEAETVPPVATPTAPTPRAPSPAEIAARDKRLAGLLQQLAACEQRLAATPDDPASDRERLQLLAKIALQYPWQERIPLWEQLLVECDAYIRNQRSGQNLLPLYHFTTFFPGLEVTPETLPLPPEWQERRDRFLATFRNLSIAELLGQTQLPEELSPFEAITCGAMTMQPVYYWNYERMQQERKAFLAAYLRSVATNHPQSSSDPADWNGLCLEVFGGVNNPGFGQCPWDSQLAATFRNVWNPADEIHVLLRQSPLPFARTLEHQLQLIHRWADPETGDFAAFTRDYAAMLAAIRRDDPGWFVSGDKQPTPYLNGRATLLLEDFVKLRFPKEAADLLARQQQEYSRAIWPK